eukprot:m.187952 g.187952  ORF g.187952 m.187952 type:complete len:4248 (-) comp14786_c2_seq1:204-12947(-)
MLRALVLLACLLACAFAAHINILGPPIQRWEGGYEYSESAVCSNFNPKKPYCAYEEGRPDGTTITISGIPLNCDITTSSDGLSATGTGACSTTAPNAKCHTTAPCKTHALIVDGFPLPTKKATAIAYNMGLYTIRFGLKSGGTPTCSYDPKYKESDFAPGQDRCTRLLNVTDTVAPVITLLGETSYVLQGGDTFEDPGAVGHDVVDGNMEYVTDGSCPVERDASGAITKFIGAPGEVCRFADTSSLDIDSRSIKNQTIYYIALDTTLNYRQVTRTIILEDTLPPLLTLCGPQQLAGSLAHEAGQNYRDAWCTPQTNPCVDAASTSTLTQAQCEAKAECKWDVGERAEDGACYLKTHTCFDIRDEDQCGAQSGCMWCPRGVIAHDIVDGDATTFVQITNPVDVNVQKQYKITYQLTDNNGNKAVSLSRIVVVKDRLPPTLTLIGEDVVVEGATFYFEQFATAVDDFDGDVTQRISLVVDRLGNLDCTKSTGCGAHNFVDPYAPAGTDFLLTYSVFDSSGNKDFALSYGTRRVHINDTTPPHLELLGPVHYIQEGAQPYIEPGALAFDTLDDDDVLTKQILIGGDIVDVNAPAFTAFNLSYNVKDSARNPAPTLFRQVIISDTTPPNITRLGEKSITHSPATAFVDQNVTALDALDGKYDYIPRYSSRIFSHVRKLDITCAADEFESLPQTALVARTCQKLTVCTEDQYEATPATVSSDRLCLPLSAPCALGPEYELVAPTATSDRACETCGGTDELASDDAFALIPVPHPCFDVQPLPTTISVTWPLSEDTPAPLVVFVNDTVQWLFNPALLDIVADNDLFDSRLAFNRSDYLPAPSNVTNTTSVPSVSTADPTTATTQAPVLELFSFKFNASGIIPYTSTLDPTVSGVIEVVDVPTFDSCNLEANEYFAAAKPHLADMQERIAVLEEDARKQQPFQLPAVDEDSDGLCQQMQLVDLQTILFDHQYDGRIAPGAMPSQIVLLGFDTTIGEWQHLAAGATTWNRLIADQLPFRLDVANARLRFVPFPNEFGVSNVTWALGTISGVADKYHATGFLAVNPINDSPTIRPGARMRFIDEDASLEDIGFTRVSELLQDVQDEDRETSDDVESGIAVVGIDSRNGVWQFACDEPPTTFAPFRGGEHPVTGDIFLEPNPASATLLNASCAIRFVPNTNFNSEFDSTGAARPDSDTPTISYRAWDHSGATAGLIGEPNIDTTDFPGTRGSPFSATIVSAPITVYFTDDAPTIRITNDGSDFRVTFKPGQEEGVPIVDPEALDIESPDGPMLSTIRVRINNVLDSGLEALTYTVGDTGLLVTESKGADFSVYTIQTQPGPIRRRDKRFFFAVLSSMRYMHTGATPTIADRIINIEAGLGGVYGDLVVATVEFFVLNLPPRIRLGDGTDADNFITYNTVGSPKFVSALASVMNAEGDLEQLTIRMQGAPLLSEHIEVDVSFIPSTYSVQVFEEDNVIVVRAPVNATMDKEVVRTIMRSLTYQYPWYAPTTTTSTTTPVPPSTTFANVSADGNTTSTATTTTMTTTTTTTTTTPLPELTEQRFIEVSIQDTRGQVGVSRVRLLPNGSPTTPWVDLNGLEQGQNTFATFQEEAGAIQLATDNVFIEETLQVAGATVSIGASTDCASERLFVEDGVPTSGVSINYEPDTGVLTMSGDAAPDAYALLLANVMYDNQATNPAGTQRNITFTVHTGLGTVSNTAYTLVTLLQLNDGPIADPLGGAGTVFVEQDISDWSNEGWSVASLVAPTPPKVSPRPRFNLRTCGSDGCTWAEAAQQCSAAFQRLCKRSDIESAWPNKPDGELLAWLADVQTSTTPTSLAGRSFAVHDVQLNDLASLQTTYYDLIATYPDAHAPRFTYAWGAERSLHVPIAAACCENDMGDSSVRRARVVFDSDDVSGTISFEQRSPEEPTFVRVNLKRVGRTMNEFRIHGGISLPSSNQDYCKDLDTTYYDPTQKGECSIGGAASSDTCTLLNQDCAVGDLSGRMGTFGATSSYFDKCFVDWNIPLFGKASVVGLSVAVYRSGRPRACANIERIDGEQNLFAEAAMSAPLKGSIIFRQHKASGAGDSDVTLFTDVQYISTPRIPREATWQLASSTSNVTDGCPPEYTMLNHSFPLASRAATTFSAQLANTPAWRHPMRTSVGSVSIQVNPPTLKQCVSLSANVNPDRVLEGDVQACIATNAVCDDGDLSALDSIATCHDLLCLANGTCTYAACHEVTEDWIGSPPTAYSVVLRSASEVSDCVSIKGTNETCSENPELCAIGDLTNRFGFLPLFPVHRHKYVDSALSLSGDQSLIGQRVVMGLVDGSRSCGTIVSRPAKPRVARATLHMNGIVGTVVFSQDGAEEPTHVRIEAFGTNLDKDDLLRSAVFSVQELPLTSDEYGLAQCRQLGDIYNPLGASGTCSPTTPENCPVGDLSGRHGALPNQAKFIRTFTDANLPLYGENSIIGRSLLLRNVSRHVAACATIRHTGKTVAGAVKLHQPIVGSVLFEQLVDGDGGETTITFDIADPASTPTSPATTYDWTLRQAEDSCSCARLGDVLGPDSLGALSTRLGQLRMASASRFVFTSTRISLAGDNSVLGSSLALESGGNIVACAQLVEVTPRVSIARIDHNDVFGTVKLSQAHPHASVEITVDLNGLSETDNRPAAASVAVRTNPLSVERNEEGRFEFSCASGGDAFNPYGAKSTCNNRHFASSFDSCAAGDIGGKHADLDGIPFSRFFFIDPQLQLFGAASALERGVVVTATGVRASPIACANLHSELDDGEARPLLTASLTDSTGTDGVVGATVTLTGLGYSSFQDVQVAADMMLPEDWSVSEWLMSEHTTCEAALADPVVFNPFGFAEDNAACGTGRKQLACALGDLTRKHGRPPVNGRFTSVDQQMQLSGRFTAYGRAIVLMATDGSGANVALCGTLQWVGQASVRDVDTPPGDLGIAIVDATTDHGEWQYKVGTDGVWAQVPEVSDSSALHIRALPNNRLRFRPSKYFRGSEDCEVCPLERAKSCVPCPLNRLASLLSFKAWDGTNFVADGAVTQVSHSSNPTAYSNNSVTVSVNMTDSRVNETAPHGTAYTITYDVRDNVGNSAATVTRSVAVLDEEDPTIVLRGQSVVTHEAATPYVDEGVAAFDTHDIWANSNTRVRSIVATVNTSSPLEDALLLAECVKTVRTDFNSAKYGVLYKCTDAQDAPLFCVALKSSDAKLTEAQVFWDGEIYYHTPRCAKSGNSMSCYSNDTNANLLYPDGAVPVPVACSEPVKTPSCYYYAYRQTTRFNGNTSNEVDTYSHDGASFVLHYEVRDAAGHTASVERTVNLVDTTPPTLQPSIAIGTIEYNREPSSPNAGARVYDRACAENRNGYFTAANLSRTTCVYAWDSLDQDVSCGVEVHVAQFSRDKLVNMTGVFAGVDATDRGMPLQFDDADTKRCVSWNDAEFALPDNVTGPLSECASVTGGPEVLAANLPLGTRFLLTYTASDWAGNEVVAQRLLELVDTEPPRIIVSTDSHVTIPFRANYTEADARAFVTAFDEHDGDVTDTIGVINNVNPVVAGDYAVDYTSVDLSGNKGISASRKVTVLPEELPDLAAEEAMIGITMTLTEMEPAYFNTLDSHDVFRQGVWYTLRYYVQKDFSFLLLENIVGIVATGTEVELDVARRREAEVVNATLVTFNIMVSCNDSQSVASAFANVVRDGRLLSNLSNIDPDGYDGVDGQTDGQPAVNIEQCTVPEASRSLSDGVKIAIIIIPVVIVIVLLVLFVYCRTKPPSKLEALLHEQEQMVLQQPTGGSSSRAGDNTVQVGGLNIPMGEATWLKPAEDIYSFHTPTNIGPDGKKAAPNLHTTGFQFSQDDTYEVHDSSRSGFASHDQGLRSGELQEIYAESRGQEGAAAPPPPPKASQQPAQPAPLPFFTSEEGMYETHDSVHAGFATHDKTERTGDLANITEELYEVQGKASTLRKMPAAEPAPPSPGYGQPTAPLPFISSEEGMYETQESVHAGFATHDKTERTGDLANITEELYEVQGKGTSEPSVVRNYAYAQGDAFRPAAKPYTYVPTVQQSGGNPHYKPEAYESMGAATGEMYEDVDTVASLGVTSQEMYSDMAPLEQPQTYEAMDGQDVYEEVPEVRRAPAQPPRPAARPPTASRPPASVPAAASADDMWYANPARWLHPELSRQQAEEKLLANGALGCFLIRRKGAKFAISILAKPGMCEHHVLEKGASGFFTLNGDRPLPSCRSLQDVVRQLANEDSSVVTVRLSSPVAP